MATNVEASGAVRSPPTRWAPRRLQAYAIRAVVYLGPIALSIVFVHYAGLVVPAPLSSLWLYLAWWFGLSLAATAVLVAVDRVTRRLLPLAALLHLSLVFPDEAPSRFKIAFRAGNVDHLEGRMDAARSAAEATTPSEAASRLLELVAALNIHDPLTRGHCDRVRAYSVMIGEELGLSRDELDLLNWAALLHDVGKLEVPTEILAKDGRPTDDEWETLRKHPLYGESLVRPLESWLGRWTSAVGFHHERWDGKGYPRGLVGEEIPLAGRIVAVADVFDVITSARSYKKASAAEEGRTEIARCAGQQFDPTVVRAFLNVSLGRMRLVMGPLSWLAHAPLLGRLPFTPALGTAAGMLSVAATSTAAGIVGPPPTTVAAAAPAPVAIHARDRAQRPVAATPHRVVLHRAPHAPRVVRVAPPAPTPIAPQAGVTAPPAPAPPAEAPAPSPDPPAPPSPPTTVGAPASTPPTFTRGPNVVVPEDSGSRVIDWASGIHAGSTGQKVTFSAITASADQGLFAELPSVSADGRLAFIPAPDAFGQAHVTVTAHDENGASAPTTLLISILSVNDPPSFVDSGDVTFAEDGGADAVAWARDILPGPPNEASQHVTFDVSTPQDSLFAPGGEPTIAEDGTLSFTPAPFATGTADVTATAIDDGGTANGGADRTARTFRIVIAARNHPPTLVGIGNVVVNEDASAQSIQWTTNVGPGAPDEGGQNVSLSLVTGNASLFSVQPVLSQNGLLTFTPAPDANGTATATVTAHDNGGTAGGGQDTTTRTFTITLAPVNDAPTFSAGGNVAAFDNAGAQSTPWATIITAGPPNEVSQALHFTVSNDDNSLFAAGGQPAVGPTGTLTFTPAPGASGTATVTVVLHDDGGTANGGSDTSAPTSFLLTITAVNKPPSFTAGGDVASNEDVAVANQPWASNVSAGAGESSQTVSFAVSNDNNALFATQPTIDASGALSYTPAANASGSATITVTAHDDGGTAGGGIDTSSPTTFALTIDPVNDAPTFSAGGNVTVLENAGPQSAAWASNISAGPPDEASQLVHFTSTNDNGSLFTAGGQPAVGPTGTLTFTPASGASGSANVTVQLHDDGGTTNGGVDTSAPVTFVLSVTAVNQPPSFTAGGNVASDEDVAVSGQAWASSISAGPGDSGQTVSFAVSNDDNALFSAQPTIDASGALSYTPAANANGTAIVTVTAHDDGGTANGGIDTSSPVTFTLTVSAINDAPTIAPIAGQTVNEDDGPQIAAVTSFSPGPANEAAQALTISTSADHPEYFEAGAEPTFDASGNLSYTPATGAFGTATVTVTVSDDGGTASGGVDTTSTTFTITLVPLPPIAGDDAYATTAGSLLTVDAAHGVLANDTSVNFPALTVTPQTTSAGLLGGTLTLAADGSFTYQTNLLQLLGGQDRFTYTITDGNGQTATGTITIDVSLSAPTSATFYLQTSGLSSEIWALGTTAPGTVTPVPDLDGDGHVGLSIAGGDGKQTITDPNKQQAWTYETGGSTLPLHGPMTLNLTAATQNFDIGKAETLWVYVYDCPGGSSTLSTTGCTLLGQNQVVVAKWNTTAAYATHSAVVPVDSTLAAGRQLRVRLLVGGAPLWIPLVGPYQSSVDYTG